MLLLELASREPKTADGRQIHCDHYEMKAVGASRRYHPSIMASLVNDSASAGGEGQEYIYQIGAIRSFLVWIEAGGRKRRRWSRRRRKRRWR